MKADFHKSFDKQFAKVSNSQKILVLDTIELFLKNHSHQSLRNHPLKGEWCKYRSVSADDDLRLHYRELSKEKVSYRQFRGGFGSSVLV
jgi:mRNA-degrading endonuclease YafQ of YafQ-DinJ toxin-antitoxin module